MLEIIVSKWKVAEWDIHLCKNIDAICGLNALSDDHSNKVANLCFGGQQQRRAATQQIKSSRKKPQKVK